MLVVKAVSSSTDPNSILGNVLHDIRELMSHFLCCKIQHGNRLENRAAHKLARYAWNVDDVVMWYGDMPTFLKPKALV